MRTKTKGKRDVTVTQRSISRTLELMADALDPVKAPGKVRSLSPDERRAYEAELGSRKR
jgi:hypothetical protein